MKTLFLIFLAGITEFRSSTGRTYGTPDSAESRAYDIGREIAHRLTFRIFEN